MTSDTSTIEREYFEMYSKKYFYHAKKELRKVMVDVHLKEGELYCHFQVFHSVYGCFLYLSKEVRGLQSFPQ